MWHFHHVEKISLPVNVNGSLVGHLDTFLAPIRIYLMEISAHRFRKSLHYTRNIKINAVVAFSAHNIMDYQYL